MKKIILSFIGASIFLTACSSAKAPEAMSGTPTPTPTSTSQAVSGTFQSLLGSTGAKQCTFTEAVNDTKVNGTIWIANGKMKGDMITTTASNTTVNAHIIIISPTMYMWTEGSAQGMKLTMPTGTQAQTPAPGSQAPNLNQTYTYNCQGWTEDDSVFSLPQAVSFTDFATKVNVAPTTTKTTTGASSQCAVCNNIPAGAGRTACLTQLNCQ